MEKCICGSVLSKDEIRPGYLVGEDGKERKHPVPVSVCVDCGVIRQRDLPFNDEESYEKFYAAYPPSNAGYVYSGGSKAAAKINFKKLGLGTAKRLLDIGCGNGSMVMVCREEGIDAWGCEIAKYTSAVAKKYIYFRRFESIYFPTDYFDHVVSMHVLEHLIDPHAFLKEAFRVTSQEGKCTIEVPNPIYEGHWKRNEHLWYFTMEQLSALMEKVGFINPQVTPCKTKSEEQRIIITATKPKQIRKKLALPPGVGDVYWPLVKMQSFLASQEIDEPVDVYIAAPREKKYNGHVRSMPFIQMFPFLNATGEARFNNRDNIWKEAYLEKKRSIFPGALNCDWFVTWNGYLRAGVPMEEVNPEYKCNWHLPRFVSLREDQFMAKCKKEWGDYIALYWIFAGTNGTILKHLPIQDIAQAIAEICRITKCKPVLVGAQWDGDDQVIDQLVRLLPKDTIDFRGKTNLEEVFGLMRGAKTVFGMNSGITIMSAAFKVKTVMVIHDYLFTNGGHRDFAWNIVPPDVRKTTFFAEYADRSTVKSLIERVVSVVQDTEHVCGELQPLPEIYLDDVVLSQNGTAHAASIRNLLNHEPGSFSKNGHPRNAQILEGSAPLTVVCVLKSGGEYSHRYVEAMRNMVGRHLTMPHKFICFSDMGEGPGFQPLKYGMPGWWSKLELFQVKGPVLYFDLDTVILGNIDRMGKAAMAMPENTMQMLTPFNQKRREAGEWASGVMAWHGDFRYLLDGAPQDKQHLFYKGWDQVYIFTELLKHGVPISAVNKSAHIYSSKRHCQNGVPAGAEVICFHGNSRPHNTNVAWVKDNWR